MELDSPVGAPDQCIADEIQYMYIGCIEVGPDCDDTSLQWAIDHHFTSSPYTCTIHIPEHISQIISIYGHINKEIVHSFPVSNVSLCVRGEESTAEYIALSVVQQTPLNPVCHVIKCKNNEMAEDVLLCFSKLFEQTPMDVNCTPIIACPTRPSYPPSTTHTEPEHSISTTMNGSSTSENLSSSPIENFEFEGFLEMKEDDGKGGFVYSPQEKNCFKLRRGREKRVIFTLQQVEGPRLLQIHKCFGLLLAAGRNVRHSDMHLLDMQSMGRGNDDKVYSIDGLWDPNMPHFEVLNTETPRDTRVFVTVAADVILSGVDEPVRLVVECKVRITHQHESFWYITRKAIVERYYISITKCESNDVISVESGAMRQRRSARGNSSGSYTSPNKMAAQLIHPADDDESDCDEPLLSGSGLVTSVCAEEVLSEWAECIDKWRKEVQRPKELNGLIREGVPDSLRAQVWPLLVGVAEEADLINTFRLLLGKCPSEQTILRDIHRTFPAHDYFKEAGGLGQDALLKLSKAYSLYDEEIGYCQGLSFLAASLLLHASEEQAFCLLVKIMYDYGLRDLFKPGFEALHLRFYQLERMIGDYIPDLHQHLCNLNIETHMYASQWFLTLFTAKFPLSMVFHIIDLFLSEGMNTIFHISLALLRASKKDLLQLDFEGALKYFRVSLPRRFRTENAARELIQQAVKLRISHKRLSKYEKDYLILKQKEAESIDPLERLERENLRLKETILRLERENDDLAHELVTSKIHLRHNLDAAEDNIESLQAQLERLVRHNKDLSDENQNMQADADSVKEMTRRELSKLEAMNETNSTIISNYKQICSDLSQRLEKQQTNHVEELNKYMKCVLSCENCRKSFDDDGVENNIDANFGPNSLDNANQLQVKEDSIRHLELELAQTKLALVETQCRCQDLTHAMANAQSEMEAGKNTWIRKTFHSIKEAATTAKTHNRSLSSTGISRSDSHPALAHNLNGLPSDTH